jgi:hypothetical protein
MGEQDDSKGPRFPGGYSKRGGTASDVEVIGKRRYRDFITVETRDAFDAAFQQVLGQAEGVLPRRQRGGADR